MATILSVAKEIADLVSDFEKKKVQCSVIESNINDYVHWLEMLELNAVEISKVTKALNLAYRDWETQRRTQHDKSVHRAVH